MRDRLPRRLTPWKLAVRTDSGSSEGERKFLSVDDARSSLRAGPHPGPNPTKDVPPRIAGADVGRGAVPGELRVGALVPGLGSGVV